MFGDSSKRIIWENLLFLSCPSVTDTSPCCGPEALLAEEANTRGLENINYSV